MQNAAWPGQHPVPLSKSDPIELKYRLVIHAGETDRAQLQLWQQDYAH